MQPITGIAYRKLKAAMAGNLAIYAAHLPLDVHPAYGNNALLAKACGLRPCSHDGLDYHGVSLGTHGEFSGTCAELEQKLETVLGTPDLAQAAALGCRTYVTGEGSHWNIPLAQELGVNLVFGGHYFTETFGVKALGLLLKDVYGLDYTFIDLPPSAYSH